MRGFVRLAPIAALVTIAACVPARDNPHDSSRVPDATLSVIDATLPDGTCGSPTAPTSVAVSYSFHRECVFLLATGDDPQNGSVRFRFSLLDSAGAPSFIDRQPDDGEEFLPATLVQVPVSVIFDLPFDRAGIFRVEVRDREGAVGIAEAPLSRANTAPSATIQSRKRVPIGGDPWAPPSSATVVRFDGSGSLDPESDPIQQFCWSTDGAAERCVAQSHLDVAVAHDAPTRRVVSLRTFDGERFSLAAYAKLTVRDPAVWTSGWTDENYVGTPGDFARIALAPPLGVDFSPSFFILDSTLLDTPGGPVTATYSGSSNNGLIGLPYPAVAPPSPTRAVDSYQFVGLAKAAPDQVWTISDAVQIEWSFERFTASRSGAATDFVRTHGPFTQAHDETLPPLHTVDATGSLWLQHTALEGRFHVTNAGVATIVPEGESLHRYVAMDARPDDPLTSELESEVWLVRLPKDAEPGPTELVRWNTSSPGVVESFPLGTTAAGALRWASPHDLWLDVAEEGLLLLDADLLAAGASLTAATLTRIPLEWPIEHAIVDPVTRELWGRAYLFTDPNRRTIFRASPDGTFVTSAGLDYPIPQFVGELGEVWWSNFHGFDLATSEAPDGDGLAARTILDQLFVQYAPPVSDESADGIWTMAQAGIESHAMRLIDADGAVARSFSRFFVGAAEHAIPANLERFALDRDGRGMWLITTDDIFHLDLTVDPPTGVLSAIQPSSFGSKSLFVPSAPGADPFVWTWSEALGEIQARRLDGTLARAVPLADAAQTIYLSGALTPADSGLCLATRNETTRDMRLRHIAANGAVTSLYTIDLALDQSPISLAVAVWSGPGGDVCWFAPATHDDGFALVAVRPSGEVLHSLALQNLRDVPSGIAPRGEHAAWVSFTAYVPDVYFQKTALFTFPVGSNTPATTYLANPVPGTLIAPGAGVEK